MKKIIMVLGVLVGLSTTSQAAQLVMQCTQVALQATLNNTANMSCPGFGVLASNLGTINSVRFVQTTDYNVVFDPQNPGNVNNTSITYSMTVPGTVFDTLVTNRVFTRNVTTNPLLQTSSVPPAVYEDYLSPFFIGVTINAIQNDGGVSINQATFDGAFIVDYTLPPPQNGEIPEPSTMGLMGAGLVAAGVMVRRKRS